ncbi:1370_t:CDS:2, partial [Acaulospora colombiana]
TAAGLIVRIVMKIERNNPEIIEEAAKRVTLATPEWNEKVDKGEQSELRKTVKETDDGGERDEDEGLTGDGSISFDLVPAETKEMFWALSGAADNQLCWSVYAASPNYGRERTLRYWTSLTYHPDLALWTMPNPAPDQDELGSICLSQRPLSLLSTLQYNKHRA